MIWKLLGALSGAALVGLWWLLVLERPILQPREAAAAGGLTRVEETVGPRPAGHDSEDPNLPPAIRRQPPEPEPSPQVPVEPADPALAPKLSAQAQPAPSQGAADSTSPPTVPRLDAEPVPVIAITGAAIPESSWHPLWTPFRSQASAQGFANHLSRLSGRRLTVEQQGPGQYRVHMAYRDESDLEVGLARITEVSGLSPGGAP